MNYSRLGSILVLKTGNCLIFCYGDEENEHCACTSVHLTTANQSEIRKAYLASVIATKNGYCTTQIYI